MTDKTEAQRLADELMAGDVYESYSRPVYGWAGNDPCDEAADLLLKQEAAIQSLQAEHDEDQAVIAVWRGRTERAEAAIKVLREALTKRMKGAEQSDFETWAEYARPSGDVESVQYQWEHSGDYMDFCAEWAWATAALTATEGL